MANENKIASGGTQADNEKSLLSKIKGLFKKTGSVGGGSQSKGTRAFHLTRKDSIVSVLVALVVVGGAVYYGRILVNEYMEINSRSNELKNLSSYDNVKLNQEKFSAYSEGMDIDTVNSLILVNNNIDEELTKEELFKEQQEKYYGVLLKNIYLPSLNIWKDPYTKNFDMGILGERYLDLNKFQIEYLMEYWSNFVEYVGNDADYNQIERILVGEKIVLEGNPEYFYVPITISFSSPNKRSFLLLVNKLSITSNQNNIALLDEFFYYLLEAIRKEKAKEIDQLMEEYLREFSSSSTWNLPKNVSEMTETEFSQYRDKVIGYNLYHWVNGGGINSKIVLVDDSVIESAIKNSVLCKDELNQKCLYNFREKYRNLPYLAYKIGLENQKNRVSNLLEFLQSLPPVLVITNFSFERYSSSSFLNNEQEKYQGNVAFNVYGRNITDLELDEANVMLGKLCFGSASDEKITPDDALRYVDNAIALLGENHEYSNVFSLTELQTLLMSIRDSYGSLTNYDKMVKLFEIWRMINDANLCNK